jgi:uncharacterized iron-regulated membrane protein
MNGFRSVLFWIHLTAGLLAGVVILVMSVTGVALTYQRQMQWWADTRHFDVNPSAGATRRAVSELVMAVQAVDPATPATTVTLRSDPRAPAAVALGPKTIYVNPYTAEVYGEGTGAAWRRFFAEMVVWHRYLAMSGESRPTGRAITGAANLLFLFLVVSGVYLWWPKSLTWSQFRNILWFRGGLRPKARDFNWHNVLGFWSALPLALVVYSGVVISYPWAGNMVYRAVGEEPPPPAAGRGGALGAGLGPGPGSRAGGPVDLDRLFTSAASFEPAWTILGLRVPTARASTTTVTVDRGDGGQPYRRGTLTIDVATGAVRAWDGFATQSTGRRARSFLRFAHTGEFFGLTGQTIAGLVSAAGVVLVYTGLALSYRRFRQWRIHRHLRKQLQDAA